MVGERKLTFRELMRRLKGIKGLDNYQLKTFINNTLYILDVIYYSLRSFRKGEKIPQKVRIECFPLLHPKGDRIRFSEIQRSTKFSKRTIAKHLKWLKKIGLVEKMEKGYYSLTKDIYDKDYSEYIEFKNQIRNHIKDLVEGR